MLGPGPPKRKGGSKNASTRAINTAGVGSSVASSGGASTDVGSSPTVVGDNQRLSGENWNRKRYQREDEELWGNETPRVTQRIREAIEKAESSVGSTLRAIEGRLSKSGAPKESEEERHPYYVARNPPVNDLHPPVVSSQPTHKGATRWMLQPPPSAKVMEGKERANRSRSGSRGSSRLGADGPSLSRQVTGKAVEERIRRGENPSDLELRAMSSRVDSRSQPLGSTTPKSVQARTRSLSLQSEASSSSEGGIRRSKKPQALFTVASDPSQPSYSVEHIPVEHAIDKPSSVARPPLETIASSSMVIPLVEESKGLPLKELPNPAFDSALNSNVAPPGSGDRLPTAANAMPVSIPTAQSKFPGADTYKFPPVSSNPQEENIRSAGEGQ